MNNSHLGCAGMAEMQMIIYQAKKILRGKPIHEQYDSDGGKGDDVNVPLRTPLFGCRELSSAKKEGKLSESVGRGVAAGVIFPGPLVVLAGGNFASHSARSLPNYPIAQGWAKSGP